MLIIELLFLDEEAFLLYSRKQEIRGVNINNAYLSMMPAFTMPQVSSPLALDFYEDRLFWVENDTNNQARYGINSAFLNGTSIETVIDHGKFY